MRIIGLDIHRAFAEAVAWDEGELKRLGRIDMRRHLLEAFAKKLSKEDVVVVEATGNASSVAAVIAPHVKKVVIANPKQVRIIAHAKIKTDTIDASVLARVGPAGVAREEAARSGAESGIQDRAWPKRRGPRVQYQEPSRSGAPMGRTSRDGLHALRLRLESAWSQAGAHGCRDSYKCRGPQRRRIAFSGRSIAFHLRHDERAG